MLYMQQTFRQGLPGEKNMFLCTCSRPLDKACQGETCNKTCSNTCMQQAFGQGLPGWNKRQLHTHLFTCGKPLGKACQGSPCNTNTLAGIKSHLCIMPFWQGHYSSMLLLVLKSGLVSWKCNRTRYLGMILELSLVLLTPIEQLWPSLDTCPTKSSLLKFMLSLGFMWHPDSTRCMNVWNLNTMLNISKPFDKAHLLRKSYDRKNLWARFMLLSNSWGVRNLPPSS